MESKLEVYNQKHKIAENFVNTLTTNKDTVEQFNNMVGNEEFFMSVLRNNQNFYNNVDHYLYEGTKLTNLVANGNMFWVLAHELNNNDPNWEDIKFKHRLTLDYVVGMEDYVYNMAKDFNNFKDPILANRNITQLIGDVLSLVHQYQIMPNEVLSNLDDLTPKLVSFILSEDWIPKFLPYAKEYMAISED